MTLHLMALLTILVHLTYAGMRMLMSLYALELGATAFTVGLLMSVLAVAPMLFVVSWGRYVDRVGTHRPMWLGTSGVLAAALCGFAVPRLEMFFVSSALAGLGFILYHLAVNQMAGLLGRPEDRTRNFTVLALAFSTSTFIAPVITGYAIEWLGHRATFLFLAGSSLATLAVLMLKPAPVPRPGPTTRTTGRKSIRDLLGIPVLRRVLVVSGLLSMAWDLFSFVMPIHGSRLGLPASTIGLVLGCFGSAVFVVRLMLPFIMHRVSEWKILIGAMFLAGSALAVIPLIGDVPVLMVISFVLGIGLGGTQPMIMALLYDTAPAGRAGEAVGVRTLLLNFSQAGIPLGFGALGAALGMAPVFWSMALALWAGGWYARRQKQTAGRESTRPSNEIR
ncbi:MAG TPA: MFS transporter [Burkholderiales bacterium]|nr:MFS transporter [Burkholderiales bacterium]